jgi:DNA-binding CsgD family transcriptional regulator
MKISWMIVDTEKLHGYYGSTMRLSPRQTQILRLMMDGKDNEQIAAELGVKHASVQNYKFHLRQILRVRGDVGLVKWAHDNLDSVTGLGDAVLK